MKWDAREGAPPVQMTQPSQAPLPELQGHPKKNGPHLEGHCWTWPMWAASTSHEPKVFPFKIKLYLAGAPCRAPRHPENLAPGARRLLKPPMGETKKSHSFEWMAALALKLIRPLQTFPLYNQGRQQDWCQIPVGSLSHTSISVRATATATLTAVATPTATTTTPSATTAAGAAAAVAAAAAAPASAPAPAVAAHAPEVAACLPA